MDVAAFLGHAIFRGAKNMCLENSCIFLQMCRVSLRGRMYVFGVTAFKILYMQCLGAFPTFPPAAATAVGERDEDVNLTGPSRGSHSELHRGLYNDIVNGPQDEASLYHKELFLRHSGFACGPFSSMKTFLNIT